MGVQLLRRRVGQRDAAFPVDDDDSLRRVLYDRSQPGSLGLQILGMAFGVGAGLDVA